MVCVGQYFFTRFIYFIYLENAIFCMQKFRVQDISMTHKNLKPIDKPLALVVLTMLILSSCLRLDIILDGITILLCRCSFILPCFVLSKLNYLLSSYSGNFGSIFESELVLSILHLTSLYLF